MNLTVFASAWKIREMSLFCAVCFALVHTQLIGSGVQGVQGQLVRSLGYCGHAGLRGRAFNVGEESTFSCKWFVASIGRFFGELNFPACNVTFS